MVMSKWGRYTESKGASHYFGPCMGNATYMESICGREVVSGRLVGAEVKARCKHCIRALGKREGGSD